MKGDSSLVARLVRELDRSFKGPTWHGPTLYELVRELDASVVVAEPPGGTHRIGEIVGHAAIWKHAVRCRLEAEPWSPASDAENFPSVVDAASWQACLKHLEQTHEALVQTVSEQTAETLDRLMPAGEGTAIDQILGVIQHDLYHAGQVSLLLKQQGRLTHAALAAAAHGG